MADSQNSNYLHWLNVDWVKEHSTLSNGLGLPLVNRFVCFLNAPMHGKNDKETFKTNGWLEMQVMSVDCPNFGIDPVEQELNGAKRFYFKGRNDSDLGITFFESPSLLLRRFFYDWMQMAVTVDTSGVTRNYMSAYMPTPSEFMMFPLDYKGEGTYCDRFINVFPYDVSGISYNYAEAGEIIKTTVKFKYMYHHITKITDSKQYKHLAESENMAKVTSALY